MKIKVIVKSTATGKNASATSKAKVTRAPKKTGGK